MNIETLIQPNLAIVYDQDSIPDPSQELFEAERWAAENAIEGSAKGRGNAYFLKTPFGAAVLRHYRRGGWAARFSTDRYVFAGFEQSRPYREFRLLARMTEQGLPVPRPLAAMCVRGGLFYRGALLTRTIPGTQTLAELLDMGLDSDDWIRIGACIRRFHAAGVRHADLNARNILLQQQGSEVFLLDFDRGSMISGSAVDGKTNLARLRRSLEKLWPSRAPQALEACWTRLIEGYGV